MSRSPVPTASHQRPPPGPYGAPPRTHGMPPYGHGPSHPHGRVAPGMMPPPPNAPAAPNGGSMLPPVQAEQAAAVRTESDEEYDTVHRWSNMTRTIAHYERIEQIGEGTYGQVYRARCLDTGRIVALKKIRVHHGGYWGMPPTVIREIKILKRLRHPHLVQLYEVVSSKGVEHLDEEDEREVRGESKKKQKQNDSNNNKGKSKKKDRIIDAREGYKGNLFLVLEYVSHDLTGLMDVAYKFAEVEVKSIFHQLLEALSYMHQHKYVHRDIKSSNILIDSCFRVKLADFGLARCIEPPILDNVQDRGSSQEFTNKVITLWYRPPEVLLGATKYGPPVDVWSAGCILFELLIGKPLFPGDSEMNQLKRIFDLLGTPTTQSWEGFTDLKLMKSGEVTIDKPRKAKLRDKYGSKMSGPVLNLMEKLLELDPSKRLTAERALQSRYFLVEPRAPTHPEELGQIQLGGVEGHFHEFQTKKKRREAKSIAQKALNSAKERGLSEKEAEKEYDEVYRETIQNLAKEPITTAKKKSEEKAYRDQDKHNRQEDIRREDRKRPRDDSSDRDDKEGRTRKDRKNEKDDRRHERDKREDERKTKRRREQSPDIVQRDRDRRDAPREEKPKSKDKETTTVEDEAKLQSGQKHKSKEGRDSSSKKDMEESGDRRHRRSEEKSSRSERHRRHYDDEHDYHKDDRSSGDRHRRDRRDRRHHKDRSKRSRRDDERDRSRERSPPRRDKDERDYSSRRGDRDRRRDRDRDRGRDRERDRERDRHRESARDGDRHGPHPWNDGRGGGPPPGPTRDGPPPRGDNWGGPPRGEHFSRPPPRGGRGDWCPGPPPGDGWRGPERGPLPLDRGPPPGYRGERDGRRDGRDRPRDRR